MKSATAYAMIWISVATAVSVGIIATGNLGALWALFIPAFVSLSGNDSK